MFSVNDIAKHMRKAPFVPFRLVTSAGESFDVLHPELIMVGNRTVTIGLADPKNPLVYEDQIWIALMHITAIHDFRLAFRAAATRRVLKCGV
jgi:hypothetical protein